MTEDGITSGSNAANATSPEELATLQARIAELEAESEQRLTAWQRAQADYQNLKKRSQQEVEERVAHATGGILRELLPLMDDFDRAMSADQSAGSSAWVEGIGLIHRKLAQLLDQWGVQPIAAEGQRFDPAFHEAVGQGPGPAGQVLAQVQKGYLWGGRVLRPVQVIVGADEEAAADASAPPPDA